MSVCIFIKPTTYIDTEKFRDVLTIAFIKNGIRVYAKEIKVTK